MGESRVIKSLALMGCALVLLLSAACAGSSSGTSLSGGTAALARAVTSSSVQPIAADRQGEASTAGPQPYDIKQINPEVTQDTIHTTIGISGWASSQRLLLADSSAIKKSLMKQHGYVGKQNYELDHFIPLGVGGSNDLSNLWLEPIAEARLKDRDEALAHRMVTSGQWTLEQGQQYIRDRWKIYYTH